MQAVRKALKDLAPTDVQRLVTEANLRGRGGAGFPTGKKWSFVPMGAEAPRPKYLVVNADEMEPGTFKDRLLLEGDPHQMIESMIVAGYAIEADVGYIFLRAEYHLAAERLHRAIVEARDRGYLGRRILGTGFTFDVHLHTSAGRYICGEETALLNALEGKRAIPRAKPPFPQVAGLWGQPTVVQNVETLYNVPHIVLRGPEWYRGLGKGKDGGTKLYGVSGKVKRPGWWELPMGTTVRELLLDHAGGMQEGLRFEGCCRAVRRRTFWSKNIWRSRWTFRRSLRPAAAWAPARWSCSTTGPAPWDSWPMSNGSSPRNPAAGARPAAKVCRGSRAFWNRSKTAGASRLTSISCPRTPACSPRPHLLRAGARRDGSAAKRAEIFP